MKTGITDTEEVTMSAFIPKFEYLGNCQSGELVRLKVRDESQWAIMCAVDGHFVRPVMILSPTEVKTVNIAEDGRIVGDFDRIPVLSYGKDYTIEPDHSGQIILVAGDISKIPGRILQSKDEWFLVAAAEGGHMDYVSLKDAKACSEPGGPRALYSRWRLTHKHITRDGVLQTLLEFDATKLVAR